MEPIVQKATTILTVDGEQAKNEIDDINVKLKDLDKALKKADKENDHALHKSLTSQKNNLLANRTALQKHIVDVNKVLNNLSVAKPKELSATIVALKKQLNDPSIKRGSDGWNLISEKMSLCKKELASVNSELQIGQSGWNKSTGFISKYVGFAATAIASITGITVAFSRLKEERDKLESSAAGVKALTGLGDEDVAWLTDQAKKLSTSVTSEGVRIKQTATEISDSFGVIGSQRPELLKNAEALKQVTQDAIYLSIAGKDQLEPAAKALTTVMNQMNLGAEDSRRIINAIAAGSQAGAGNIQYITEAFEKSGTTANLMNIELEQHIGLIEAVAPKYAEAAVAGTSLDRVLSRMKGKNIGYKDGVFDLSRAIDEIAAKFNKGESAVSLFGEEHAKMAEILVMNKGDILKYTEAVTDTNKAVEQANINSDINEVKRKQVHNKITLLGIELMDQLNPSITKAMDLTVSWTERLVSLAKWINENKTEILTLILGITSYIAVVKAEIIIAKIKVLWNEKIVTSLKRVYATMLKNPYALMGMVILTWILYMKKANRELTNMEAAQGRLNKVETQAAQNIAQQKTELEQFLRLARDESESKERRLSAIKKINEISPEYLGHLTLEEINTGKATVAVNKYIDSIYEMAKAQAAKEQLIEIEKEKIRLDTDPEAFNEQIPWWEKMEVGFLGLISKKEADKALSAMVDRGRARRDKTKTSLDVQAEELRKIIDASNKTVNDIITTSGGSKKNNTPAKSDAEKNKEAEKLKKEFEQTLKLNDEYHSSFKNQEKRRYLDQEINSAVYNKHIEMLEMASLDNRIELMKQFNEKLKPEHEKLRVNIEQEQEKLLDKRIAFLKKWEKTVSVSDVIGGVDQEDEETDPEMDKLIERTKRSYEYKQEELKNQYENNEITQLEYQQRERDLQQEHLEEMLSSRMNFANQVGQIASQAASLVSAMQQREELAVENKYAGQLKAAKGNAEKTAALEEQMEEEKKAVKKKYADIDFAISAAQIIASTAAGIMQLWVKPGFPAAIPLAALVGATGIAQLLLANEQRQQVKNLWTGGYTSPGRWDEPKGVVHSEEFVGNRFAVRNKSVNRVFRMIDLAQKNNTIASINETDIIRSLGAVRSGSPEKEVVYRNTPSSFDPGVTEALTLVSRSVSDLKRQMEEGTLARTYVTGDGGTKTARDKYDKMLKNVTRYTKK